MQSKGTLYLIPTPLSSNSLEKTVVPELNSIIKQLDYYLVEDLRTARRFISSLRLEVSIEDLKINVLNKKTSDREVEHLLAPLKKGRSVGLMSEAGCPGIADPGSRAVALAHKWGYRVYPITGSSSITLALMASGFNGQQFCFHGYLPIKPAELNKKIRELEEESSKKRQTQIFIEAPYRNERLLAQLLSNCKPSTMICVAKDLTGDDEKIVSKRVKDWQPDIMDMHKVPSIFLMLAE